jgi:hypothetical protein
MMADEKEENVFSLESDVNNYKRRWYDHYPHVATAFRDIREMPLEYQHLFGQVVLAYYERLTEKKKFDNDVLSLGSDRALGLFKIQQKRRYEDRDPLLFKAMTTLFLFEKGQRVPIAECLSCGMICLKKYMTACEAYDHDEDPDEIKRLFKIAIEHGIHTGELYLKELGLVGELEAEEVVQPLSRGKQIASKKSIHPRRPQPLGPEVPLLGSSLHDETSEKEVSPVKISLKNNKLINTQDADAESLEELLLQEQDLDSDDDTTPESFILGDRDPHKPELQLSLNPDSQKEHSEEETSESRPHDWTAE